MPSERDQSKKRKSSDVLKIETGNHSDLQRIKELIALIAENELEEIELEEHGWRVRIRKGVAGAPAPLMQPHAHSLVQAVPPPSRHVASHADTPPAHTPAAETPSSPDSDAGLHMVRSPMVGTFYRASNPAVRPFVEIGDRVDIGAVLCIIEAMKLMNNIDSDVAGEVVRIYAENAQPVEYNQPLFGIRIA